MKNAQKFLGIYLFIGVLFGFGLNSKAHAQYCYVSFNGVLQGQLGWDLLAVEKAVMNFSYSSPANPGIPNFAWAIRGTFDSPWSCNCRQVNIMADKHFLLRSYYYAVGDGYNFNIQQRALTSFENVWNSRCFGR